MKSFARLPCLVYIYGSEKICILYLFLRVI